MESTLACPSCGAPSMGRFCQRCGEKRRANHDFSIRHYVGEAIETFTHFDSKILRTAWLLVSRPGVLSANYLQGRLRQPAPAISPIERRLLPVRFDFSVQRVHDTSCRTAPYE